MLRTVFIESHNPYTTTPSSCQNPYRVSGPQTHDLDLGETLNKVTIRLLNRIPIGLSINNRATQEPGADPTMGNGHIQARAALINILNNQEIKPGYRFFNDP